MQQLLGYHIAQCLWEGLCQGAGKESLSVNPPSDSRKIMWFSSWLWNHLEALQVCAGVCPSSRDVCCGSGEHILWGVLWDYGVSELLLRSIQFQVIVGLCQARSLSPVLFIIFMDMFTFLDNDAHSVSCLCTQPVFFLCSCNPRLLTQVLYYVFSN